MNNVRIKEIRASIVSLGWAFDVMILEETDDITVLYRHLFDKIEFKMPNRDTTDNIFITSLNLLDDVVVNKSKEHTTINFYIDSATDTDEIERTYNIDIYTKVVIEKIENLYHIKIYDRGSFRNCFHVDKVIISIPKQNARIMFEKKNLKEGKDG